MIKKIYLNFDIFNGYRMHSDSYADTLFQITMLHLIDSNKEYISI